MCSPSPSPSNVENIAQFGEGIGYGMFGVKEVECLRMGELKQIRILSLKSMIIASLSLEYKEVL